MKKKYDLLIVILLIVSLIVILYAIKIGFPNENSKEIYGKITLISGDCMPKMCEEPPCPSSCKEEGISRKIFIRELTTQEDLEDGSPYLKEENKPKLIKTIISKEDGTYETRLPVGKYSFFIEDNSREYCNSFNNGYACMIEINENKTNEYNFTINHAAY